MLNLYEIFIICHYQCQNFWEPTLKIVNTSIFIFKNKLREKKKSQKCIASNIHLNATLLVCHGYCSHVAVIGLWGWFVVVALLGRRWNGRIVRRQFWCVVCTWETNELYVGQWDCGRFQIFGICICVYPCRFLFLFLLFVVCFFFFFNLHKRWECFF